MKKAIEFVQQRGNAIERARLAHLLHGEPPPGQAIEALAAMQNPDGGFSYFFPGRRLSTIADTTWVMLWMDDLGLTAGPIAEAAVRFLRERQCPDGGWDEVAGVRQLGAPAWLIPGRTATRTWLSAYCGHVLLRFGHVEDLGAEFLLAHQRDDGRLEGYLRATWIALPALSIQPGRASAPFRRALAYLERRFSPEWHGSAVAWMLRCLADAGVPAGHSLVQRARTALGRWQRPDGAWDGEDGPRFDVTSTIDALRALIVYGRL